MNISSHGASPAITNKAIFWVVACSGFVRILFILTTWGARRSNDIYAWIDVGNRLLAGVNPYAATSYLNHPPFWMQYIFAMEWASMASGLSFLFILQSSLVVFELILITAILFLIRSYANSPINLKWLLIAFAFNPVFILLTGQHGNFDVLVALTCTLSIFFFAQFQSLRQDSSWLFGCLFLGIAILIKTIPLILIPLALIGARQLNLKTKCTGLYLILFPIILGMSIIYVLAPVGVKEQVLNYRSYAGYFGVTGIMELLNFGAAAPRYSKLFQWSILTYLIVGGWYCYRLTHLKPYKLILLGGLSLMAVPLWGPGYGPQYLFWSLPFFIAMIFIAPNKKDLRLACILLLLVAGVTYPIEYGLFNSHGALFLQFFPNANTLKNIASQWSSQHGQTYVRLPIFITMLSVFFLGLYTLRYSKSP